MHRLFFSNLVPGTILFNRYELLDCLSSSDLGGVYTCRLLRNPKELVALKILSTPAAYNPHHSEDFEREVQLSFSVVHPNVVRALEWFKDGDFTAFAMEFVHGGTLADYLELKRKRTLHEVMSCLTQLASGLSAIHEAGIIHRDLKPENILVDMSGRLKIADFGIAVGAHDSSNARSPIDHLAGTINYLSPEYVRDGIYDVRSDIYAFGVIAYELITGSLPFSGRNLIDTLAARVTFDPAAPRSLRPDIPRGLSDLTLRAMRRDPARRFQNVAEIISTLDVIKQLEIFAHSSEKGEDLSLLPHIAQLFNADPLAA